MLSAIMPRQMQGRAERRLGAQRPEFISEDLA
jgi:hypothetical protein